LTEKGGLPDSCYQENLEYFSEMRQVKVPLSISYLPSWSLLVFLKSSNRKSEEEKIRETFNFFYIYSVHTNNNKVSKYVKLTKKENIISKLVAAAEDMLRWKLRGLSIKKTI
jgi:hypothetical protein